MKNLVLLSSMFPYGKQETFLESEINYFDEFENVYIFNRDLTKGKRRDVPSNCICDHKLQVHNLRDVKWTYDILVELFCCIKKYGLIKMLSEKEIYKIMIDDYTNAYFEAKRITKSLDCAGVRHSDPLIIYSYWMHTHAIVAILLKRKYKNSKLVTRCHGFDIYEERLNINYLSFRYLILNQMDLICPISNDGKEYLYRKYSHIRAMIEVNRLGVKSDFTFHLNDDDRKKRLHVVSCSNMVPVKRIDRMISAFAEIVDFNIKWVHFGDGSEETHLRKQADKMLGDNIEWEFKPRIPNQEILNYLKVEQPHCILNTSESEGIPVSMMEAMSYGIPVIATNVGGVKEIVAHEKNGFLMSSDFSEGELVKLIRKIYEFTTEEYYVLKQNAIKTHQKKYNADINYSEFANRIQLL